MDITREQYQLWKYDPVTKLFIGFLLEKRKFLIDAAAEQWLGGSDVFATANQTVRGQIVELGEIADLPFEAIDEFYKERENEGESPISP
ncbi:MAG: hypothetical protein JWP25_4696 [Bradyrhizobium sp.]|nr:hypothetical protein [Bradyrhizobium sp.]